MNLNLPTPESTIVDLIKAPARDVLAGAINRIPPVFVVGNYKALFHWLAEATEFEFPARVVDLRASPKTATLDDRSSANVDQYLPEAFASLLEALSAPMSVGVSMAESARSAHSKRGRAFSVPDEKVESALFHKLEALSSEKPTLFLVAGLDTPFSQRLLAVVSYFIQFSHHRAVFLVGAESVSTLDIYAHALPRSEGQHRPDGPIVYPPRLSAKRIEGWLGQVEKDLSQTLLSVSGKDDYGAAVAWAEWRSSGFVHKTGGIWRAQPGVKEPFERQIYRTLSAGPSKDPKAILAKREILRLAAQCGNEFSGSLVSEHVAASRADLSTSEAEDLLDEMCPTEDGPWLVQSIGHPVQSVGSFHWRYQLSSDVVRSYLASDSWDSDDAQALLDRGWNLHRFHPEFASTLLHLAVRCGDTDRVDLLGTVIREMNERYNDVILARIVLAGSSLPNTDPQIIIDCMHGLLDGEDRHLSSQLGRFVRDWMDQYGTLHQRSIFYRLLGISCDETSDMIHYGSKACELAQTACASSPADVDAALLHIHCLVELGTSELEAGHIEKSRAHLERTIDLIRDLGGRGVDTDRLTSFEAMAKARLGSLQRHSGQWESAGRLFVESLDLFRGLSQRSPHDVFILQEMALVGSYLSTYLAKTGKPNEALDAARVSFKMWEDLLATNPASTTLHANLALQVENLGYAYLAAGDTNQAIPRLEEASDMQRALWEQSLDRPAFARRFAVSLCNLGQAYGSAAEWASSEAAFLESIAVLTGLPDPVGDDRSDQTLMKSWVGLAEMRVRYGNYQGAEEALSNAIDIASLVEYQASGRSRSFLQFEVARLWCWKAFCYLRMRNWSDASSSAQSSVRLIDALNEVVLPESIDVAGLRSAAIDMGDKARSETVPARTIRLRASGRVEEWLDDEAFSSSQISAVIRTTKAAP